MKREFIYDVDTKNISFLQTAMDLKTMGIKNNKFFLKLYDTQLRGVDPYSPFLPDDIIMRIVNECIINPWYFLREVALIPDQGSTGIHYQLNRANLAVTWCFLNGIDSYLVIPRQIGKTQSVIALLDWAFLFGTTTSEFMFCNKLSDDAIANLKRLKEQRDLLPTYLQMKMFMGEDGKIEKETDNVKTLYNPQTKNRIVAKPSAKSIAAAESIGRGCTQPVHYYDEVDFTPYIKTIMEAAGPAFNTASTNAKRNDAIYGRIFSSTPGDLDTQAGQDALLIIEKTCKWSETFYDKSKEDVEEYLELNSENRIVYIEYQYQQLGKNEEWFKKICTLLNNNPLKIKREVFLQRLRGSSESPYEPEDLQIIEELRGKVIEEIFINKNFKLDIYERIDKTRSYMIGVDVANGYGSDNSAVTVVDPYSLKPVAEFKSPYISVVQLQNFLRTLVLRHFPRGILCIERNANGEAVIDALCRSEIAANVYFDNDKNLVSSDIDDKLDSQGFLKKEAAKRKLRGVWTQGNSRETMFSILGRHIQEFKDKFVGNNLIDDILRLVRKKTGKIEAGPGFHDDSLMSYLMVLYVYYHGNNLNRFGFVKGDIPDEDKANKGLTYDEVMEELNENEKRIFENSDTKDQSEYTKNIIDEINKARKEAALIDTIINPLNTVENYDDDVLGLIESIPMDFFDELNE